MSVSGDQVPELSEVDHPSNEALSFNLNHREGDGEVEVDSDDGEAVEDPNAPLTFKFSFRKLLRFMGPGWLMSLAYLDPGNLESDLQQGAYTRYHLVWVLWWATVMGLVLQELSSRIGVVTGMDMAQMVRSKYPKWLNYVIYVNMEIAVIASDIQEVVGSGIALNLLSNGGIPVWAGCIITGADTFTFLAVHYLGVRYLEALVCFLVSVMSVSFFINWGETDVDAGKLMMGWIVPRLPSYALTQAVGTIGAVIMPHNLYLHSGLVLSRRIDRNSSRKVNDAIQYNFLESGLALLTSFFINLAVVASNAGNFYTQDCAEMDGGPYACLNPNAIDSADRQGPCELPSGVSGFCGELGLAQEGAALQHGLGSASLYIWAVGLLAAGQAATMTCTYAGQIIMGGCLQIELAPWKRVAFTRVIALGPSIIVAAATISDNNLFNRINEYLNVLQSLQLPFAMLPVMAMSSRGSVMGRFRPRTASIYVNFALAALVLVVNFIAVLQFSENFNTAGKVILAIYGIFYVSLCGRMCFAAA